MVKRSACTGGSGVRFSPGPLENISSIGSNLSNQNTRFVKGQIPHNKFKFTELDIQKIISLYYNKKYSHEKIAKIYHLNASTIGDLLKRLGKQSRKSGEGKRSKGAIKPAKQELEDLYIKQKKSVNELSIKFGVKNDTMKHWIISYGLEYRKGGLRKLPKDFKHPSKEELNNLHHIDRNSKNNLALKYGVSKTTITRWFKEQGIISKYYTRYSNIELIMRKLLEANNLVEGLEEQYVIKLSKGYTRADFAFPLLKVAIFCDGDYWHGNWHAIGKNKYISKGGARKKQIFEKTVLKDGKVHFELMSQGWTALRFNERDIQNKDKSMIEIIRKNLFDKEFIKERNLEQIRALEVHKLQEIEI